VIGTLWLVGEEVTDKVFTVQPTLQVNKADDVLTILRLRMIIMISIRFLIVQKTNFQRTRAMKKILNPSSRIFFSMST
jgi:hypothetical protein